MLKAENERDKRENARTMPHAAKCYAMLKR
jgi:hypothetical protein